MTSVRRRVPNGDVTPELQVDPFVASPRSRFAILALGCGLHATAAFTGYLELRTQVYTVQTEMLTAAELTYGIDIDDDDDRATAFLVIENRDPRPVAVACVRVIERLGTDRRPLPADDLYGLGLEGAGVEVSRYIARLSDSESQSRALIELLRSTIAHIRRLGMDEHVYAIVEPPLERILRIMGVGVTRVAEPLWIDEYRGVNLAIQLDPVVSAANLGGLSEIDELDVSEGSVRFWGEVER